MVYVVSEFLRQCFFYDGKGPSLVVGQQVFDVFEKKRFGSFLVNDSGNIKKQGALGFVHESMGATQSILFRYAGNRKWLAREACEEDIVLRYFSSSDFSYIAMDLMRIR